ncbi:PH domain-containing protein [Kordiimonas aquimaris]|uniref:PH domain-containing protein n=1 Tax=Kordiimonas aquimaris TaxID=707591 RepID=UPI0021CF4397|nr:PH domain-containing protein [Kordiimonas aquimaris]
MTDADVFTNEQLQSSEIPHANDFTFEALEKRYCTLLRIIWFGVYVLILGVNGAIRYLNDNAFDEIASSGYLPLLFAIAAVIAVAGIVVPYLVWRSRGFQLRAHDIHYKHGALWRHVTYLPFCRIQHVEIESGPLERLCKLSTLKFYSAGGGSADMKIPGLGFATAAKIRTVVMSYVSDSADDTRDIQEQPHD